MARRRRAVTTVSEVEEKLKLLGVLARRLEGDAEFMAHALSQYRRQRGLDEAGLAQELGASPRMLARLALCRQPQPGAADYTAQVNAIAEYAHVEPERLAALLNAVEVEEAVQAATVGARSRAAARGFVARFGALIRQAAAATLRPARGGWCLFFLWVFPPPPTPPPPPHCGPRRSPQGWLGCCSSARSPTSRGAALASAAGLSRSRHSARPQPPRRP
jgi:hypothetical protein